MRESIDIKDLVNRSRTLGQAEIDWLNTELASKPWCASYQMLLAKAFDNQDSFLKQKQLQKAATYAGHREKLFELMYSQVVMETEKASAKHNADVLEFEANHTSEDLDAKEASSTIDEIIEQKDDSIDHTISSKPKESAKDVKSKSTDKIDFDEIVTYDPLKELKVEAPVPANDRTELAFDYVAYDPEKELEKLVEEKEEVEEGAEKDFIFWLNNVEDDDTPKPTSNKSPDVVQDLLEQFLATKRSRPLKPREFYKAEVKAEESEVDKMDVISETLLDLYVKQGHYAKAIEGYEKLSLLNPPKSAYFAARIKEIQESEKDK